MSGTMRKAKVGIIGCGNISRIYCKNLQAFEETELVFCADLDPARAAERAAEFGVPKSGTAEELLADPEVEIVVNLTIPASHAKVSLMALEAGKHVYAEKPITVTREEALALQEASRRSGKRIAGAPETFLGGAIQTCRRLIDEGAIGRPVAASAFMLSGGHEGWHPDPEFYYKPGGGPMFDMGPYYLTALVTLLGPIASVTGSAVTTHAERRIGSEPKKGTVIHVEVPTHLAGVLDFESGPVATLVTSFDTPGGTTVPPIEIYGTEGTLLVPDPNNFGGDVKLRRIGQSGFESIPLTHGYTDNNRGVGVADMARAIRENRPHRASGDMAAHVLEAMHGIHDAAASGMRYRMRSRCERPEPMPALQPEDGAAAN